MVSRNVPRQQAWHRLIGNKSGLTRHGVGSDARA